MNYYLATSAVFLLIMGITWTKKDLPNLLVKMVFLGLGGWGLVLYLISTGYVIHK